MDATAKFLAIIAVAAFVTERILAAINYVIDAVQRWRVRSEAAAESRATEWRKLLLFLIAAVIAYVVVRRANLHLLEVLQVANVPAAIDLWLTWLVVVAGADRVHSMLTGEGKQTAPEVPVVRLHVDGDVRDLRQI